MQPARTDDAARRVARRLPPTTAAATACSGGPATRTSGSQAAVRSRPGHGIREDQKLYANASTPVIVDFLRTSGLSLASPDSMPAETAAVAEMLGLIR